MTTFRNPLLDPLGTRHRSPLVRGPQFENRCHITFSINESIKHTVTTVYKVGAATRIAKTDCTKRGRKEN